MGRRSTIGSTKGAGFEAGSRRTYDLAPEAAWALLVSPWGGALLTGRAVAIGPGANWSEGPIEFEVTTFSPPSHFRMKWRLPGWAEHSILQVRVLRAAGGRATVAIHQERLSGPEARREMLARWEAFHADLSESMT
jgi:hypothetical protein